MNLYQQTVTGNLRRTASVTRNIKRTARGKGGVGWNRSWTSILTGRSKNSSFCFTESRLSSGSYAINFRFRTVFYVTFAFFYLDNEEEIKYGHEKVPFTTEFRNNEYEFGSDGITIRGYIYDIESGDEGAFLRVSLNTTIISTVHYPLGVNSRSFGITLNY